jgi:hypothetical protein
MKCSEVLPTLREVLPTLRRPPPLPTPLWLMLCIHSVAPLTLSRGLIILAHRPSDVIRFDSPMWGRRQR